MYQKCINMRYLGVFIVISLINTCYGWSAEKFIYPYQSSCPNDRQNVYEKEFPCIWEGEVNRWDMNPIMFLCKNVPNMYHVTYNSTSILDNSWGYSISLWEYYSQRYYYDGIDLSQQGQINLIQRFYNEWKYNAEPDWRRNEVKFVQPLNGDFAYDFTGNDHFMPLAFFNNGRTYDGVIAVYVDREQFDDKFECFYLMFDISII